MEASEMKAQPQKEVLVMPRDDRVRMLEGRYAGFPGEFRKKVRFQGDRFCFTVKGVGSKTGNAPPQEKFLGCDIQDGVRDMLLQPGYDADHRLVPGRDYDMVLFYGSEIGYSSERTKTSLRNLAKTEFGDKVDTLPQAEFSFLVRTMFTYLELQLLGLEYVAVLHDVIKGDAKTNQFFSQAKTLRMQAWFMGPDTVWSPGIGFAFPLV